MKLTLKAFKDAEGHSGSMDILGDKSDMEKEQVFSDAKLLHKFPTGYARLEKHYSMPSEIATFISDEVAASIQNEEGRQEKLRAQVKADEAARNALQKNLVAANKQLTDLAAKRNKAISECAQAQDRLHTLAEKDKPDAITKINALKEKQEASIEAFKVCLEQVNIVRNPKTTLDDKRAAYIKLGIIKAEPISQP